jgi:tRNA threonylcarbamoyladenosine biosynthesis protein TsaE
VKLLSRNPSETEQIGEKIGRCLKAGDVVKLYGELGAGKTTMVKGIAGAFGIPKNDVTSPSFSIITEYDTVPRFVHVDLFRVSSRSDLESTGMWECIGGDSVAVVEWPEMAEGDLGETAVIIRIRQTGAEERTIEIEGLNEEDWNNL